jgi:uncharacterized protein (DUF433 family)
VGVRPATLRTWILGYERVSGGRPVQADPVVDLTIRDPRDGLSFINLIEVLALDRFRAAGVSLQKVGKALRYVESELGTPHALARQTILTDGIDLFWKFQERQQDLDLHVVNITRGGQKAFPEVISAYLREIEWGTDRFAKRWWPEVGRREVVVDPRKGYGAPTIAPTGIRTEDVFQRFEAGESFLSLAEDFGLTIGQVEAAIRAEAGFLERLAA